MFTVKLFKDNYRTSLSCPHYSVEALEDGTKVVTVYKNYIYKDGIGYKIGTGYEESYESCYVENDAGKTIDSINPETSKCG